MGVADVVHEEQTPFDGSLDHDLDNALGLLDQLQTKAGTVLKSKVNKPVLHDDNHYVLGL